MNFVVLCNKNWALRWLVPWSATGDARFIVKETKSVILVSNYSETR